MPINKYQDTANAAQTIPLSERRSALTMGLLWLTMVASFPAVLAGFEWYRQGITLPQLAFCSAISVVVLLLYSVPACELGARTGMGYCKLGQVIFGRWGGALLSINLLWLFIAWYSLTAVLMAQAVLNLFHWHMPLFWLSVIFAFLMAFNNFFGFSGVANFARFMAAPVIIAWAGYVLWKALHDPLPVAAVSLPHPNNLYALSVTSSFIIGFAVWGNEQDYWRYSKPGILRSAIPLLLAIIIGQIIFPLAGWFIARASGSIDYQSTLAFMSNYCFGGIAIIGLLILTADYFSTNDSSLFGGAVAVENLVPLNHTLSVAIFAVSGAIGAALLSLTDMTQSLSAMVSLNCVILPTPTIIMISEWFLQERVFASNTLIQNTNNFKQLPAVHMPAIIALFAGLTVGIATSGLIPVLNFCHFGIAALNAWLTSIFIYIPLRIYEHTHKPLLEQYTQLGADAK
jgi:purine-cytosine permease-like protein